MDPKASSWLSCTSVLEILLSPAAEFLTPLVFFTLPDPSNRGRAGAPFPTGHLDHAGLLSWLQSGQSTHMLSLCSTPLSLRQSYRHGSRNSHGSPTCQAGYFDHTFWDHQIEESSFPKESHRLLNVCCHIHAGGHSFAARLPTVYGLLLAAKGYYQAVKAVKADHRLFGVLRLATSLPSSLLLLTNVPGFSHTKATPEAKYPAITHHKVATATAKVGDGGRSSKEQQGAARPPLKPAGQQQQGSRASIGAQEHRALGASRASSSSSGRISSLHHLQAPPRRGILLQHHGGPVQTLHASHTSQGPLCLYPRHHHHSPPLTGEPQATRHQRRHRLRQFRECPWGQ
ncbi:hypothetical protein NDU88_009832 [Pleurodeles waltl]|uniref:Uncharacterized protein n=1 Tax=Pleurodeles waltl TaxID=8319 RepID=A0AAV7RZH8_PLEWA|nr:hypothetical protein NDU88_009832 [Pleurodeles waltl]